MTEEKSIQRRVMETMKVQRPTPKVETDILFDAPKFAQLEKIADKFAKSKLVPDCYRGDPASCFVALQLAMRLHVDPFMLLQKTFVLHGRPGMEAQLMIAIANRSGVFRGPITWRFEGEGAKKKCTAIATMAASGEIIESTITWAMVQAEGWDKDKPTQKGGMIKSKWNTMTDQMFRYRTASWLIRAYAPEVLLGLYATDEIEDIETNRIVEARNITPITVEDPPESTPTQDPDNALMAKQLWVQAREVGITVEAWKEIGKKAGVVGRFEQATTDQLDTVAEFIHEIKERRDHQNESGEDANAKPGTDLDEQERRGIIEQIKQAAQVLDENDVNFAPEQNLVAFAATFVTREVTDLNNLTIPEAYRVLEELGKLVEEKVSTEA